MHEGLAELLYRAIGSQIGIVVRTSNPDLCRQKLYATRKALADPALEVLSVKPSHSAPASEVWILRKSLNSQEPSNG